MQGNIKIMKSAEWAHTVIVKKKNRALKKIGKFKIFYF